MNQTDKATRFRSLHEASDAFVIGNAWDAVRRGCWRARASSRWPPPAGPPPACSGVATARCRATRRWPCARGGRGLRRAGVGRPRKRLRPRCPGVSETIRLAAEAGLVGGSIEDLQRRSAVPDGSGVATHRGRSASGARAAVALHLTARCENFLRGNPDLDDTIARLQAFERAGADVLMAPGLARSRRRPARVRRAEEAVQLHGRHPRQVVQRGRVASRRCQAHQPGDLVVPRAP